MQTDVNLFLLDTGLAALKTASKRVAHKAAEATSEFIGYRIADKIVRPYEKIIISPKKREKY